MTTVVSEIEFDGNKIREARGDRKLAEIAEKVGISRQALWQIENGLTKPTADVLLRLCSVLNITSENLIK